MRRFPVHPVLFATFPVLFLFTQNAERVRFGKVILPLVVVVAIVAVVTLVASLVLRNLRRGALVGSTVALLALSYGHVYTAVAGKRVLGFGFGRDLVVVPLWCLLGLALVVFAWRVKALAEVTAIANAVAVGLVAVSIFNAVGAVSRLEGTPVQARVGEIAEPVTAADDAGTKRDVYLFVFDRYGSRPILDQYMGIDNAPFVRDLRRRGFVVSDDAQSNYPTTAHSLASSMNLRYLDHLERSEGSDSKNWTPLYKTLVGPRVARFFQDQGYRYAHIGSWYDPTAHDATAQVNFHYDKRSEFTRVLLETTIVQPIAKRVDFLGALEGRRVAYEQIRFQLDSIMEAAALDGPAFTFVHVLLPHEPFTFDAEGNFLSHEEQLARSWEDGYEGQVRYANKRILEIVDRLTAGPDSEDPIIVLEADEGPKRPGWRFGDKVDWRDATDRDLHLKFGILSAAYMPGADVSVPDDATSVNVWRRILNEYFGTDLEMLPDRNYIYGDGNEPYRFTDVTERADGESP